MATAITSLVRRMRRALGDQEAALDQAYSDADLIGALTDYLEDTFGPVVTKGAYVVSGSGIDATVAPDLSGVELRLAALGASIQLLSGHGVAAAEDALSTDSPAGRVNTVYTAERIKAILDDLREEYGELLPSVTGVIGTVSWMPTTGLEATRVEAAT